VKARASRLPDEQYMNLEAFPVLPVADRVRRLVWNEWNAVKQAVHRESANTCHYCGRGVGSWAICDHRIPIARGGDNSAENLVTACERCNALKGMLTPDEFALKKAHGARA
jgi:5-methylcytosine-specific restriction endonuclease McrA